jgi:peptide/nickel transport system permease protein
VVVFLLIALLTFLLPRLMPGDPLDLLLSSDLARQLTPVEAEVIREQMGLTGSWPRQLGSCLLSLATGDLGYSLQHAAPVADLLSRALPWTLLLIACALPLYLVIGVAAGIEAGRATGSAFDRASTALATFLASIPPFAAAVLLLLAFGIVWPVLPISGAEPIFPAETLATRMVDIASHAVLPASALAFHEVVRIYFLARAEAAALSQRPFVANAKARGIRGARERVHYYGRNLLAVLLARLSDSITSMFGAVLFVEVVFSYPGVGRLIYDAVLDRDYVLLQGAVLGLSAFVLVLNWVVDTAALALASRG